MQVTAVGLDELRATLRRIDRSFPAAIVTPAMKEAAEPVVPKAQRLAPARSGRMRSTVRALGSQSRVAVAAGSARAYYTRFVHYGTKYQKAQPFLEEAGRRETPAVLKRVEDGVAVRVRAAGLDVS